MLFDFNYTTAIIAAAGNGSRMGDSCENKLLAIVGNMPVICHTVSAYSNAKTVSDIIISANSQLLEVIFKLLKKYNLDGKVRAIIAGGENRSQSVENAIFELSRKTKYICIADGARPFTSPVIIDSVNNMAYKHKTCALCSNVTDTIKKIDNGLISKTINRDELLAMQTPQSFKLDLYKKALLAANADKKVYTDDCGLLEGISVNVTPLVTDELNLKITKPSDLKLADYIFSAKKDGLL